MFRRFAQWIERGDSGDSGDSYTSSSGDESLSDSPPKSPFRHEYDATEPRKVTLVRNALDVAYESVATIKEPRQDIKKLGGFTPWMDLGKALKTIIENRQDTRVQAALDVDLLSYPLFVVLQRDLEFLGRNKEYTRTILRDEARATYSVLRQWPDLCPDKEGTTGPLLLTPKWLLLELFRYSLDPKPVFSLVGLPRGTLKGHKELYLAQACEMLKVPVHMVLELDLRSQNLTTLPAEFIHTFPNLQELELSGNRIEWLPFAIIKCPLRHLEAEGYSRGIAKKIHWITARPPYNQRPRSLGRHSLIKACLVAISRSSTPKSKVLEYDLPPHIRALFTESYLCELCCDLCVIRSSDWMEVQRLLWNSPGARWVGVEGRLCPPCLGYLTCDVAWPV